MRTVSRLSPYPSGGRSRRLCAAAVAVLSLGIVGGPAIGRATAADFSQLQTGDCVDGIHPGVIDQVNVLPCAIPHDGEVMGRLSAKFAWPGIKALSGNAAHTCAVLAERRVVNTQYDLVAVALVPPNQAAWNRIHQVVCLVTEQHGGKLIGSMTTPAPGPMGS